MKVSVVMSCYNSEEFVATAIQSILDQTFKDFEFIIWNDGSTDNTEKIIKSFDDPRIKYFYHENTGLGTALRLACEQATSTYIARMDADDISMPLRLEKEVEYLDKHPDVVLLSSSTELIDDEGTFIRASLPFTNSKVIKKLLLKGYSCLTHPASMFRRDIYIKAGGYLGLRKSQDLLLFSRMSKYGEVINLKDKLLQYRVSVNSISTQTDGNAYTPIIKACLKKMICDPEVHDEDIALYNNAVYLSKKCNQLKTESQNKVRTSATNSFSIFNMLKSIVGEEVTRNLVIKGKNLYGLIRY